MRVSVRLWGALLSAFLYFQTAQAGELKYPFSNGSQLVFVVNDERHLTYFESRDGKRELLSESAVWFAPFNADCKIEGSIFTLNTFESNTTKFALVQTSYGVVAVTDTGKLIEVFKTTPDHIVGEFSEQMGKRALWKHREYVRFELPRRVPDAAPMTLVVGQDGTFKQIPGPRDKLTTELRKFLNEWTSTADGGAAYSEPAKATQLVRVESIEPGRGNWVRTFRFASKREVSFEQNPASRVRWDNGEVITEDRVVSFPNLPIASELVEGKGEIYRVNAISFFETESQVWAIFQNGKAEPLPVDRKRLNRVGNIPIVHIRDFVHQGKQHALVSFPFGPEDGGSGETYILRDDGVWAQIDFIGRRLERRDLQWKVSDGFLAVEGAGRVIDLNHLEGEAAFPLQKRGRITTENGGEVENPLKTVRESFNDLTFELRGKRSTTFELKDKEMLEDLRIGLQKKEAGSVALLGDSGSGKTEFIRSFVHGVTEGLFPEIPRTTRVFVVDPTSLSQGTKYVGVFEARLKLLLEVCKGTPCILFMDEIHSLRGQGTHESNKNDFFQLLKPALAQGWLKIIGTDTADEFSAQFSGDQGLMRRFTPVWKTSPKEKEVLPYMQGWLKRHRLKIPEDKILLEVQRLSDRYSGIGSQPAKGNELLDYIYSMLRIQNRGHEAPTIEDVHRAAIKRYQMDPARFNPEAMRKKILSVPALLNEKIVGQKDYKEALFESAVQDLAGVAEPNRPPIRILVAGPPGVGKSDGAKVYAEGLEVPTLLVEMNAYTTPYDVERFRTAIAAQIRKNPFTIFILDEIEKAHPQVIQAMLAMFEEGYFSVDESLGTSSRSGTRVVKVETKHAGFIATTNAASEAILAGLEQKKFGFHKPSDKPGPRGMMKSVALREALIESGLPEAVVNRFPWVVAAMPPTRADFREVIAIHLKRTCTEQSKNKGIHISIANEKEFLDEMAGRYFQEQTSNRNALYILQEYVRKAIARAIVLQRVVGRDLIFSYDAKADELMLPESQCEAALLESRKTP